ncbi:hypothetical protein EW093_06445 [Thiospirochaeta perfilievii]|uniref:Outer membrane protein assembly factor BamE n=1 Tax=Thiospirochaeta perfilievii TaxID=252967 RepID=A0A5C1QCG1_9SPIO|nr:outer membrane protein assembly factor BamE [Thiospirochaeta perfilievii]QEN04354.1 hypothetical protein EW093_06445 [Thiospirochaeta perfilievii]
MKNKIILILISIFFISCNLFNNNRAFSKESWENDPDHRYEMIDDLKNSYLKIGMNKDDVIDLLGEPESESSVYYLGNSSNYNPNPEFLDIKYSNNKVLSFGVFEG